MKTWQQILFGILIGLSMAAVILLIIQSPGGAGIELSPAPTPKQYVVHITGEVNQPGVYEIQRNSRIIDVIESAGGFTDYADEDAINQAEIVEDGSMIFIPAINDGSVSSEENKLITPLEISQAEVLNINTASSEEFEDLPDIGPTRATDIVEYRLKNGRFNSIEDIMNVPGIGKTTFEKIKDLIVVE